MKIAAITRKVAKSIVSIWPGMQEPDASERRLPAGMSAKHESAVNFTYVSPQAAMQARAPAFPAKTGFPTMRPSHTKRVLPVPYGARVCYGAFFEVLSVMVPTDRTLY